MSGNEKYLLKAKDFVEQHPAFIALQKSDEYIDNPNKRELLEYNVIWNIFQEYEKLISQSRSEGLYRNANNRLYFIEWAERKKESDEILQPKLEGAVKNYFNPILLQYIKDYFFSNILVLVQFYEYENFLRGYKKEDYPSYAVQLIKDSGDISYLTDFIYDEFSKFFNKLIGSRNRIAWDYPKIQKYLLTELNNPQITKFVEIHNSTQGQFNKYKLMILDLIQAK